MMDDFSPGRVNPTRHSQTLCIFC